MNIIYENMNRMLITNNGDRINISDGSIVQYNANYYKLINIIMIINQKIKFLYNLIHLI